MSDKYFAAAEAKEVGAKLRDEIDKFFNFMNKSGIFRRQSKALHHYYGLSPNSNARTDGIQQGGKSGQLAMVKVNHFRNIGQHLLQLTTSQRPSPQPIATNSDAKSQQQASVAKGVLDYYGREKRIERKLRDAAELAVVCGDAFIMSLWDADVSSDMGNDHTTADELGDVRVAVFPSSEVVRDPHKQKFEDLDWIIVREWAGRFRVADKYARVEEFEDEDGEPSLKSEIRRRILGAPRKQTYREDVLGPVARMFSPTMEGESEDIAIFHFFHKKTPSLPEGRYTICLEDGTVLLDMALPYKNIPVRRVAPGDIVGTPFGYTPLFDAIVIQEAIDALYSAVATNQMTFGVQLIMAMKGSDIDFKQLSRGLSFIEYAMPEGKPESLNLTHTPAEVFQFIGQLENTMETITGVNSVVRGDAPENLKSGSALALIHSQAIAFSSGLQQSYAHCVEDVYTDILNILKTYAKSQRVITIVGKYNRSMLQSFTSDSIKDINRVVVQASSALEQTVPGRMQIAQDLIQQGLVKRPEEYLAIIKTGSLDPMLEGDNAELMLIRSENEALSSGQPVYAVPTDEHSLHIREHRVVLATPETRNNPELIRVVTDHIAEHVSHLADPALAPLLMVLGQTPMAAAMMPEQGQGYNPGMPGGQGGEMPDLAAPKADANLPKNPITGQEWDPITGGGAVPSDAQAGSTVTAAPGVPGVQDY